MIQDHNNINYIIVENKDDDMGFYEILQDYASTLKSRDTFCGYSVLE